MDLVSCVFCVSWIERSFHFRRQLRGGMGWVRDVTHPTLRIFLRGVAIKGGVVLLEVVLFLSSF